jgi:pyruvate-formate lyase-activating enzyme
MLGCDFHCSYCQNWVTSQVGAMSRPTIRLINIIPIQPEQMVRLAKQRGGGGGLLLQRAADYFGMGGGDF